MVMDAAFDPAWGEAWNRSQVADSLAFSNTHYRLFGQNLGDLDPGDPAAGFTLVRAAPGEEELLLIAVAPEWRGRGLGEAMLHRAAADARGRHAERMYLEMRENNPAQRLYRRFGFAPIGRRKFYYRAADGTKIDAITFAYDL